MKWCLFATVWLLVSCSDHAEHFFPSNTEIYLAHRVTPWDDLVEWLDAAHLSTQDKYGLEKSREIMNVRIEIYPQWYPISRPRVGGLYFGEIPMIQIRMRGGATADSALSHEIFEHRVAHVLTGDINRAHTEDWKDVHAEFRARIAEIMERAAWQ